MLLSQIMDQEHVIRTMREQINRMRSDLWHLEQKYKAQLVSFQELCSQEGHDFEEEPDNDYHRRGSYYTCRRCEYLTRQKD